MLMKFNFSFLPILALVTLTNGLKQNFNLNANRINTSPYSPNPNPIQTPAVVLPPIRAIPVTVNQQPQVIPTDHTVSVLQMSGNNPPLPIGAKREIKIIKDPRTNTTITHDSIEFTPKAIPINRVDNAEAINLQEVTQESCTDLGCEWCDIGTRTRCRRCRPGFFLFNQACYSVCPKNFNSNMVKRLCEPLTSENVQRQVTLVRSNTIGSCENMCGKRNFGSANIDCSCTPDCISMGNCCSDYYRCEMLINLNNGKQAECYTSNPNCDLCENFIPQKNPQNENILLPFACGQCREGLFRKNKLCLQTCDSTDTIIQSNRICIPKTQCLVQNCAQCLPNNQSVCDKCMNGTFLFNNQCLTNCPFKMRADKISWTCLEPPVFAWYWIFPSRSSCMNNCNRQIDNFELDCSCRQDCFANGTCCPDIETYCPNLIFWR